MQVTTSITLAVLSLLLISASQAPSNPAGPGNTVSPSTLLKETGGLPPNPREPLPGNDSGIVSVP